MGFPTIGQTLFISPLGGFSSLYYESNGNNIHLLRSHKCRNLNLKMLPITFHESLPPNSSSMESAFIANGYVNAESPKTPSYNSKHPSTFKSRCSSVGLYSSALDVSKLKLALADEGLKLMYEKFASLWLYRRFLLPGNVVAVPVLEKVLLFSVEGAEELTRRFSSQDLISESENNVLLDEAQRAISLDREYTALFVEAKTKVSFSDPKSSTCESSRESLLNVSEFISGREPNDVPKLGGLSKEFAALEEIIKFSLAQKDRLLRFFFPRTTSH